jgi:hypothetical protein
MNAKTNSFFSVKSGCYKERGGILFYVFYAFIMERSITVFTRERLFMFFIRVTLFMLFISESVFIFFTKERLFVLFKFTWTIYKSQIH